MYLAYSLLLTLGALVLIPHFLFQALAHGKYLAGLRQRLGDLSELKKSDRPVIWLHCVSVGETQAARPLVERLKKEFPDYSLVVSTITLTGQTLAQDVFAGKADSVFYFPFDWRWSVRRALGRLKPSLVLIMETELWPNFLKECDAREIPVALVNGRISRQSFRRYSMISFFLRKVLADLRLAIMQSDVDASRIIALGMPDDRVFMAGNLKFDAGSLTPSREKTEEIAARFGLSSNVPLILAASTHAQEEKVIIDGFKQIREDQAVRLMLAPRHPERFNEVASLLEASGLKWTRRTQTPSKEDAQTDVILLDTIGELTATYSLATVCFVGGSITDNGGHNVLEPASVGTAVVTGSHTHNFDAIVRLLLEANAIVQLPPLETSEAADPLAYAISELLDNPDKRVEMGRRAAEMVASNSGSSERTIQLISNLVSANQSISSKKNPLAVSNASAS
jgi:3-deoxy-D-manno-octulosonic-acid transferase